MRDKCRTEKQLYIYEVAKNFFGDLNYKKLKNKSFGLSLVQKLLHFCPALLIAETL